MLGIIMTILLVAILGPLLIAELLRAAGITKQSTTVLQLGIYGLVIALVGGVIGVMYLRFVMEDKDANESARRISEFRLEEARKTRVTPAALQAVVAAEKAWGWDSGAPTEYNTVSTHMHQPEYFHEKGQGKNYQSADEQMIVAVRQHPQKPSLKSSAFLCLAKLDCIGLLSAVDLPLFEQAASSMLDTIAQDHKNAAAASCTIKAFVMRNLVYAGAPTHGMTEVVTQLQSCSVLNEYNPIYLSRAQAAASEYQKANAKVGK